MHAVITATTRSAGELGAQPTVSFAALTSLGVTDLDPVALTVLVRSYGLDGGAAAAAATLAAELGLSVADVVELRALAAAYAGGQGARPATGLGGGVERGDLLNEPGDDLRADVEAGLATLFGDELLPEDVELSAGRILDGRELTVLTSLLGLAAGPGRDDATIAAAVGLHPLTVTAYRQYLPELFAC